MFPTPIADKVTTKKTQLFSDLIFPKKKTAYFNRKKHYWRKKKEFPQ